MCLLWSYLAATPDCSAISRHSVTESQMTGYKNHDVCNTIPSMVTKNDAVAILPD